MESEKFSKITPKTALKGTFGIEFIEFNVGGMRLISYGK